MGKKAAVIEDNLWVLLKKRYIINCSKFCSSPLPTILIRIEDSALKATLPLKTIIISATTIRPKDICVLGSTFEQMSVFSPNSTTLISIDSFQIWNCVLEPNALTELLGVLRNMSTLRAIILMGIKYPKAEKLALSALCSVITNIVSLNFDYTHVGELAGDFFASLTENEKCILKNVSVRYCHIKPESCKSIANYLKKTSSLKILDLSGNQIGTRGANHLVAGIEFNTSLNELSLAFNELDDECNVDGTCVLRALLINVGCSQSISKFDITGNFFGNYGYQSVVHALEARKGLKETGTMPALNVMVSERTTNEVYQRIVTLNNSFGGKKRSG